MKLTLKKARKVETKIANHLNTNSVSTVARVLVNQTPEQVQASVKEVQSTVTAQVKTHLALTELRYAIRQRIAEQNQKVGINDLMNEREKVQHKLKVLNSLSRSNVFSTEEVSLNLASKKAVVEKGDRFGGVHMDVDVVDSALTANVKEQTKTLRKQLEDIEDSLAQKNTGAEVTLTSEEVELLTVTDLM